MCVRACVCVCICGLPAIHFFQNENVDTIILGCTHFLHLSKEIDQYAGENIQIVDSREGVVKQAMRFYKENENIDSTNIKDKSFFVPVSDWLKTWFLPFPEVPVIHPFSFFEEQTDEYAY